MKGEKFNISGRKTRILVAPLECGLGHSTRCIPIINELVLLNCEVFIGAEGASKILLLQEFPQLNFLPLKGYRIQYSRKKHWLPVKMILQFPKMIRSIYNEHHWLNKIVKENNIDAVISDNRFGLFHSTVPCIYITHQLTIKTGNRFTEWMAQKIHYHFINKFCACWVPDTAGEFNLAGELSHPKQLPKIPLHYIGPLSRFEKIDTDKKYDFAIIISGPEPQRSIFEVLLLKNLDNYQGRCIFVRGLPGEEQRCKPIPIAKDKQVEMHDHLSSIELNKVIEQSELIISRSGYTTVMDLIKLGQNAILIPTPGQTEQEYLSESLMKKKLFYCVKQKDFSLKENMKKVANLSFIYPEIRHDEYKIVIKTFIRNVVRGYYLQEKAFSHKK